MKFRALAAVAVGLLACAIATSGASAGVVLGPPMPPIEWKSPRALECFSTTTPTARVCFNVGVIPESVVIKLNGYDISRFFRSERGGACLSVPLRENWGLMVSPANCGQAFMVNVIQAIGYQYENDDVLISTRFFYVNVTGGISTPVLLEPERAIESVRAMWDGLVDPKSYAHRARLEADMTMTNNPVVSFDVARELSASAMLALASHGYGVRVDSLR